MQNVQPTVAGLCDIVPD